MPRHRKTRRWPRRLLIATAALLLVVTVAAFALVRILLPPRDATVTLPNLSAPVHVTFDANGIPFIRAANANDAAEALGYLHARDRLFEMDLMRRAAGGSLAQLIGPIGLANDEEMRRLGLRRAAIADEADLSPAARAQLTAYAAGVNAYIAQRGRFAGLEFLLLGRPAPWTIADSLLWGKMMGLWLSGNDRVEIARLALAAHHPLAQIMSLWPTLPGNPPEDASLSSPTMAGAAAAALVTLLHFPQPFTQPENASNEFAVSGTRTVSGKPLLAGDPHLGFGFPSLWYLARIDTPAGTLAGATAPGVPFIVIGDNGHIAWTFTTTGAAVQDVFIEHASADGKIYATPNGPQPFITRSERIAVRGRPDVILTVRATRHGPVIGETPDGKGLLAVEMANLLPHDTDANGLLALENGQNVAQAGIAAAQITSPVQNLLVADTSGNIGFYTTGRVPIRKAGDGAFPQDGADGKHDWTGIATGMALPHSINPGSGELINANNPTVGADFPIFLGRDNYPAFRAERIHQLLAAPAQTPASFGRIQLDVTSDFAAAILPRLRALKIPSDSPDAPAAALLRNWDGTMATDLPQPLIFNAWIDGFDRDALNAAGFTDWDDAPIIPEAFAPSLLGPGADPVAVKMWCDGDCDTLLLTALHDATAKLTARYGSNPASWRWGVAHRAVFAHPLLSYLPIIGRLARFGIAVPGDASTVDVAAPGPTGSDPDGFTAIHGPELRAIFDLSDLDASDFILAPGESGDLFSRDAANLLKPWRDGTYFKLPAMPANISATLTLLPGP
jgi:penicillin amidase